MCPAGTAARVEVDDGAPSTRAGVSVVHDGSGRPARRTGVFPWARWFVVRAPGEGPTGRPRASGWRRPGSQARHARRRGSHAAPSPASGVPARQSLSWRLGSLGGSRSSAEKIDLTLPRAYALNRRNRHCVMSKTSICRPLANEGRRRGSHHARCVTGCVGRS